MSAIGFRHDSDRCGLGSVSARLRWHRKRGCLLWSRVGEGSARTTQSPRWRTTQFNDNVY
eukprot:6178186-Pleurochrysis_carterae.AAC.2